MSTPSNTEQAFIYFQYVGKSNEVSDASELALRFVSLDKLKIFGKTTSLPQLLAILEQARLQIVHIKLSENGESNHVIAKGDAQTCQQLDALIPHAPTKKK